MSSFESFSDDEHEWTQVVSHKESRLKSLSNEQRHKLLDMITYDGDMFLLNKTLQVLNYREVMITTEHEEPTEKPFFKDERREKGEVPVVQIRQRKFINRK